MGFSYLDNRLWREVTRDERFFCQRLYELINRDTPERFVMHLINRYGLDVPADGKWEAGYEVCFYRDFWHYFKQIGKNVKLVSPKRTFDLCLFHENAIVIIEAKAAVGFHEAQLKSFIEDRSSVEKLTGVENVKVMGLCSSDCRVSNKTIKTVFNGGVIWWKDLSKHFDGDAILQRADGEYKKTRQYQDRGPNANLKIKGADLLTAFQGEAGWWIGRKDGIDGDGFRKDLASGNWETRTYEVNTQSEGPPSRNYFSLEDFVNSVEKIKEHKESDD